MEQEENEEAEEEYRSCTGDDDGQMTVDVLMEAHSQRGPSGSSSSSSTGGLKRKNLDPEEAMAMKQTTWQRFHNALVENARAEHNANLTAIRLLNGKHESQVKVDLARMEYADACDLVDKGFDGALGSGAFNTLMTFK